MGCLAHCIYQKRREITHGAPGYHRPPPSAPAPAIFPGINVDHPVQGEVGAPKDQGSPRPKRVDSITSLAETSDGGSEWEGVYPLPNHVSVSKDTLQELFLQIEDKNNRAIIDEIGQKNDNPEEESPYKCNQCNKSYVYQRGLKRHIKVAHEDGYGLECRVCLSPFTQKFSLVRHFKTQRHLKTMWGQLLRKNPGLEKDDYQQDGKYNYEKLNECWRQLYHSDPEDIPDLDDRKRSPVASPIKKNVVPPPLPDQQVPFKRMKRERHSDEGQTPHERRRALSPPEFEYPVVPDSDEDFSRGPVTGVVRSRPESESSFDGQPSKRTKNIPKCPKCFIRFESLHLLVDHLEQHEQASNQHEEISETPLKEEKYDDPEGYPQLWHSQTPSSDQDVFNYGEAPQPVTQPQPRPQPQHLSRKRRIRQRMSHRPALETHHEVDETLGEPVSENLDSNTQPLFVQSHEETPVSETQEDKFFVNSEIPPLSSYNSPTYSAGYSSPIPYSSPHSPWSPFSNTSDNDETDYTSGDMFEPPAEMVGMQRNNQGFGMFEPHLEDASMKDLQTYMGEDMLVDGGNQGFMAASNGGDGDNEQVASTGSPAGQAMVDFLKDDMKIPDMKIPDSMKIPGASVEFTGMPDLVKSENDV